MHQFLPHSVRKFMSIFAGLALLSLLFTSATHAQDDFKDPVMDAARAAGLVTEIGTSKTIGAATITLDWAYADTQNLIVSYTLKTTNGVKPEQLLAPYEAPTLGDDKGALFSYSNSRHGSDDQQNEISRIVQYYSQAIVPVKGNDSVVALNDDYFNPAPDKLNLKFELTLGNFSPSQGFVPGTSPTKPADFVKSIGPFTINFTIPLYPPVVIKQPQTIQVKGVGMSLQQVVVTPTKTTARVCYAMPDAHDWIPDGSVEIGDTSGYLTGISIIASKENESNNAKNRCRDLSFYIFYDTKPTTLNITIDHLATSLGEGPDDWNKIKGELAKHNIKIDVISASHSLDVKVLSVPEGVNYDQAVIEAREALGNWLKGPWTFKVDLP